MLRRHERIWRETGLHEKSVAETHQGASPFHRLAPHILKRFQPVWFQACPKLENLNFSCWLLSINQSDKVILELAGRQTRFLQETIKTNQAGGWMAGSLWSHTHPDSCVHRGPAWIHRSRCICSSLGCWCIHGRSRHCSHSYIRPHLKHKQFHFT